MTYHKNKAINDLINNRWGEESRYGENLRGVAAQIYFWRNDSVLGKEAGAELAEFNAWVKAEGLEDGVVIDTESISEPTDLDGNAISATPTYYDFPGGVQVRDISAHLTSFGGQALQYVARATRLDGNNKGEAVKDLRKAIDFIGWEIERLEAGND